MHAARGSGYCPAADSVRLDPARTYARDLDTFVQRLRVHPMEAILSGRPRRRDHSAPDELARSPGYLADYLRRR